jgi:hypothetical protein
MPRQTLILELDEITAGDYLQWVRDPSRRRSAARCAPSASTPRRSATSSPPCSTGPAPRPGPTSPRRPRDSRSRRASACVGRARR